MIVQYKTLLSLSRWHDAVLRGKTQSIGSDSVNDYLLLLETFPSLPARLVLSATVVSV